MNLRAPHKNQQGFTIIEVMIVLAIAGLIILIVFLAVPALQRNSRNTQRRNDAARASGLVSEYTTNQNGKIPTGAQIGGVVKDTNLSIYSSVTSTSALTTNVDVLGYVVGSACENHVLVTGGSRSYAFVFAVETSGGGDGTSQCV